MSVNTRRWTRTALLVTALVAFGAVVPTRAGGHRVGSGDVVPANAKVDKYSLADAARATAVYNTGGPTAPDVPFAIVNHDVTVTSDQYLYVPVFNATDSNTPDPAPFPRKLHDQKVIADYLIDAVNAYIHHVQGVPDSVVITDLFVQVDDNDPVVLGDEYVTGVKTPPLADVTTGPAGTHYIVSAAFVSPLRPGDHIISIGGVIDGEPTVFVTNHVTVTAATGRH